MKTVKRRGGPGRINAVIGAGPMTASSQMFSLFNQSFLFVQVDEGARDFLASTV